MSLSLVALLSLLGGQWGAQNDIGIARSPISQPYAYLNGGSFLSKAPSESPDPTIGYRWKSTSIADDLQIFVLRPKSGMASPSRSFGSLALLTSPSPNIEVRGDGVLRLDFGVESGAWVEFDSPDIQAEVEMSISEYNEPGLDKTRKPEKIGNTYRLKLNEELYEGVRFAWIHVKNVRKPWHITGLRAVCQVKPTNYEGNFSCSDSMITKAWYMSAYGVKASLCKDYFGSILMDRGDRISWTGDAHPAQAAALVAFANYDFVRKNLENTSKQDNGIRSYALYWVLSLIDYYQYTGDTETLKHFLDNADQKLEAAYKIFGTNPGLRFYGWDDGVGAGFEIWFRSNQESQSAYKMLSIRAWNEFALAMDSLGRTDLRDKYLGYANEMMSQVSRKQDWSKSFGIHAAADAVNTRMLDDRTQRTLLDREFKDRVNRLSLTPFNQYFILQAMSKLGLWDDALTTVDDMWGGMIRYGGTTTFEVFRPTWNRILKKNDPVPNSQSGIVSLCHPWGAGVVKWLSENILGISPTSPGFRTYDVKPRLGTKLTWISGTTPTPFGKIRFKYDIRNGAGHLSAPAGAIGRLGIPLAGLSIKKISINGNILWDGEFHDGHGITAGGLQDEFVFFELKSPGEYDIQTEYLPGRAKTVESKEIYPVRLVTQDTRTGGNWGGIYGKYGYVLCGYLGDGKDIQELPPYVSSIDFFRAFPKAGRPDTTVWETDSQSSRALASTKQNAIKRTASCISNSDQTMSMTIRFNDRSKHRISLYFVDWKNQGSRQAVEVMDAETLRLVSPVCVVKGHSEGAYLVFECDRSVKFRFNKIRGDMVTLSGVFFD